MSPFEYLLTFAAIVLGLAVTDLAMGLSRLLHAGSRVTWGLLTPLAAIVVFLKIISQWWTWYAAQSMAQTASFEMFIVVMIGAVLLFLLAAGATYRLFSNDYPERGDAPILGQYVGLVVVLGLLCLLQISGGPGK